MPDNVFDYAPPPSPARSSTSSRPTACSSTASSSTPPAGSRSRRSTPATEEVLAEVGEASAEDVDLAVKAARRAYTRVWSRMSGRERSKYLFRIARILQERSRELAVLESIDNGKPIKESRDVDVPTAAAHFFYYAGWADKLEHAGFGADPQPLGVAGQVIPWNFPLLMLAWKIAPALACGNTVVLKPAETTPLTALLFAEICQQADLPAGRGQHRHRRRRDRPRGRGARRRRQGRVHRLHRGRPADRQDRRRHRQEGHPRARRQGRQHRLRRRAGRPGRRGHRQRHLLQPGPRAAAPAPGCWCRSPSPTRCSSGSSAGCPRCAWATRSTRTPTSARSTPRSSSRRSASSPTSARPRAPAAGPPPATCPATGFWFPPTVFTGVTQAHRIAREEIFGPVLSVLTFRTPAEAVEKANNTPFGLSAGIWTDKGSRILWMANQLRAGVVWANTFNKFDPTSPFGGYKESGLRPRGRPPRSGGLPPMSPTSETRIDVRRPTSSTSAARSPARSRAAPTSSTTPRASSWPTPPHASRKDARDAVQAARKAFGGWSARTPYNRGQVVYRVAEVLEGRRAQFVDEVQRSEGVTKRQAEAAVDASVDRLSGTPAGPTRSPRSSAAPTRWPRRTSTSRCPSRPASSASSRRRSPRCSAWSASSRRSSSPATPAWSPRRRPAAARDHAVRGARHLRRARRRRQRAHRRAGRHRADARLAHGRQRAST